MAIQTRLSREYQIRKVIFLALLLGFGFWALYDGFIAYPEQIETHQRYLEYQNLRKDAEQGRLTTLQAQRLTELQAEFENLPSPPTERSRLDVYIQYGMAALCFPGAVIVALTWWLSARKRYIYRDDGTLIAPEGEFPPNQQTGLDLTRWNSKSIAMLSVNGGPKAGGKAIKLDAWIHAGLDQVIEDLDRRLHPEEHRAAETASTPPASPAERDRPLTVDGDRGDIGPVEPAAPPPTAPSVPSDETPSDRE